VVVREVIVDAADRRAVPDLGDVVASARVVAIPLRVPFRGVSVRETALVHGPSGWGEFAPFVEYDDRESARWLGAAIESAWFGWPSGVRDRIAVNATVPAVPAAQVSDVLARFDGCTTVKVKVAAVGQGLGEDLDRVAAVREALGASGRIRVDANGGWSLDDAMTALHALAPYRIEYVEQPCATVEELARLRRRLRAAGLDIPVAADESVRKATDPLRVARAEAADLIVVKVAPLGGVRRALGIVAEAGLPAVVSSALDTSVGMAAGVALAAALPRLDHACGLGTVELLDGDVCDPSLVPVAGHLAASRTPEPSERLLDRWAVEGERRQWWLDRISRCHAILDTG
jgi:O-succinylbenzoate synthase